MKQELTWCTECHDAETGQLGSFFGVRVSDVQPCYKAVSPIFKDGYELLKWGRENGYRANSGGYQATYSKIDD